ncbi:MAG TPA: phosphoglycolate phosphatase [Succinivibrionaceae bacterium]|nr:phosphoglycolate phosphatase [Succinivibrionaceae bacterium]
MKLQQVPKGLIFDLDGTLADTLPQLALAAKLSCEAAGLKAPTVDEAKTYVGNGVKLLLTRAIAGRRDAEPEDVDPALLARVRELFNRYYSEGLPDNYSVYPGVKTGLAFFKEQGIKLGVCTNKPQMFAVPLLKYMGLFSCFDFVLGGEVLQERKPDPKPVLYVAQKLKVSPDECAMAGDSENDVFAGQRAGMSTVFFTYGYFSADPDTIDPDHIFNDFSALTALIKQLQQR